MFMLCVCVKSFNKTKQNKTKQNKTKQQQKKHLFQVAVSYQDYNSPLQHTFHIQDRLKYTSNAIRTIQNVYSMIYIHTVIIIIIIAKMHT